MTTVWQLGAGSDGRSYHEDLIAWRVALVGPGDDGDALRFPESYDEGGNRQVKHFAAASDGDIVILKQGLSYAHALGVLGGPYHWDERFSNVRGWSLHHCRPVRWFAVPDEPHHFPDRPFTQARFQRCAKPEVLAWVNRELSRRTPDELRPPTRGEIKAPRGFKPWTDPPMAVAEVSARVRTFWEYTHGGTHLNFGGHPSEAEVRAHLVVPFLLGLGWPREQVAIEWKHMDIALYRKVQRVPENCAVVVETKTMFSGLDGARSQADRYAADAGKADILVTDGGQIEWHPGPERADRTILRGSLKNPTDSTKKIVKRLRYSPR